MEIAPINGIDLAWESFGEGDAPAILLISGLGTQMTRWSDGFCRTLAAQGFRVIRYDNRDAGLSTHLHHLPAPTMPELVRELMAGRVPPVPYGLPEMAGDAIGLMDHLHLRRAHLVGRSMGGMIAQVAACGWPDRVASLTSIMSATGNPAMPQADTAVMALMTTPAPSPETDPAGHVAHRLAFTRAIAGSAATFDEATETALIEEEARRAWDPAGSARQLAAMATAGDRRAELGRLTLPALIIHGTEDRLFPPACGEDTARAIPGARLMLLEGMGHDLPEPLQTRVAEAIAQVARS